jgi:hypothetical protein
MRDWWFLAASAHTSPSHQVCTGRSAAALRGLPRLVTSPLIRLRVLLVQVWADLSETIQQARMVEPYGADSVRRADHQDAGRDGSHAHHPTFCFIRLTSGKRGGRASVRTELRVHGRRIGYGVFAQRESEKTRCHSGLSARATRRA